MLELVRYTVVVGKLIEVVAEQHECFLLLLVRESRTLVDVRRISRLFQWNVEELLRLTDYYTSNIMRSEVKKLTSGNITGSWSGNANYVPYVRYLSRLQVIPSLTQYSHGRCERRRHAVISCIS